MFQPEVPLETVRACELARLQPQAVPWQVRQEAPSRTEGPATPAWSPPPAAEQNQRPIRPGTLARTLATLSRAMPSLRPHRSAVT